MSTIKDVAREAGVSTATVSRVINNTQKVSDKSRERVEKAMRDLDFNSNELARMLKMKTTKRIGVIVTSVSSPFFGPVIEGIQSEAEKSGYSLIFAETKNDIEKEKDLVQLFVGQWVDGIILATCVNDERAHAEYIEKLSKLNKQGVRIPVVTLQFSLSTGCVDAVCIDYKKAAFDAVLHLIKHGKTNIVHISHPRRDFISKRRVEGFKEAIVAAGLVYNEESVFEADYATYSAYLAMEKLALRGICPNGVFCATDQLAIGVLNYCKDNNLNVPEDVSVIGMGDIFVSSIVSPPLSTVVLPKFQLGVQATNLLISRLSENKPSCMRAIYFLDHHVIERASTEPGAKIVYKDVQW